MIFIVGMEGTTVWWLHDTQFQEPKVYIYCDLQSDLVRQSFVTPRYTSERNMLTLLYRPPSHSHLFYSSSINVFTDSVTHNIFH